MQSHNLSCKRCYQTIIGLAFLWLCCVIHVHGQEVARLELRVPIKTSIDLEPYTIILVDRKSEQTHNELSTGRLWDFEPLNSFEFPPKYERAKYTYWLKTEIRNSTNAEIQVGLDVGVFDSITTYVYRDRRLIETLVYGNRTMVNVDDKLLNTTVAVNLAPGRNYSLLTKFKNQIDINRSIEPKLVNLDYHHKSVFYRLIKVFGLQIAFLSILFFISFINVFLYVQSKERAYLYYGLYTIALFVFFTRDVYCSSPMIVIDFLPLCSTGLVSPLVSIIFLSYILFISNFLEAKVNTPALYKIIRFSTYACVAYFFIERLIYIFDPFLAWKFYGYFKVLFLIIHIIIIVPLFRNPNRLTLYILCGSLILIIGTLLTAIMSFRPVHFVGYMDVTYIPQYIGIILELLLFSVGLGYKVKLNEYAKRKARADVLIKKKEVDHEHELNNIRESFFRQITHDFRSPLMIINDAVSKIRNQDGIKSLIKANSDGLLDLIDQRIGTIDTIPKVDAYIQNDIVAFIRFTMDSHEMSALAADRAVKFESNKPSYSP